MSRDGVDCVLNYFFIASCFEVVLNAVSLFAIFSDMAIATLHIAKDLTQILGLQGQSIAHGT